MAEPIDMPYGMISSLGPTNSVCYLGSDDSWRGGGSFRGKHVPDKPNTATNYGFGYEGPISLKFNYLLQLQTEFNF